ncbi:MAG TPA: AI-2E family transporter [Gemmatimonadota bacterium]|nr:AI-2E family transporter [Gemmatimonadota bacterium]
MDERRPFLLIAWALLLGLFAWSVRPVLTPLVLFAALVYLLAPLFGTATYRRLVITLGALTFLWLLYVAGSVLAPFVLAFVFAYIANPGVERLERRGVGRGWGAALLILIVALAIALAVVLLVPLVMHQGRQFLEDLPRMIDETLAWYRVQMRALANSPLPVIQDIAFERAMDVSSDDVSAWIARQLSALRPSWRTAVGLGQGVQTALTILAYLVLTPVLTFYLLRDFPNMKRWLTSTLPEDRREALLTFARRYDALLGEYLRGQLLVALFVGVTTGVGLYLVGFPNAVLIGVIAGVFNLVPYLGLIVSLIPALFIAIVTPPLWLSLVKLFGVFFSVQAIEGYVLSPRIIGERVGLHPVWVMLAIIAAGSFFGIVGLLLAIPIAVLVKLLLRTTLARYKTSIYYREAGAVPEDTA